MGTGAEATTNATTPKDASLPAYLLERLEAEYGPDDVGRITRGLAARRHVTLRANAMRSTREEVAAQLDAAGIAWHGVRWYADALVLDEAREVSVRKLAAYEDGSLYLQSLSSMLPPLALAPAPGTDVLDMCAAPGGKTSELVALSGGAAHVTACELHVPRAEKLEHNLDKLGCRGVQVMRCDARRLDPYFSFDQVLLDAPCTGSGTVRAGDPKVASRLTSKLADKVARSQRALLDRALDVLKPGGTLVYSTCSVFGRENGDIVAAALRRHRDCELVALDPERLFANVEGAPADGIGAPQLLPDSLEGTITVCPDELFEGFYLAKIKRNR